MNMNFSLQCTPANYQQNFLWSHKATTKDDRKLIDRQTDKQMDDRRQTQLLRLLRQANRTGTPQEGSLSAAKLSTSWKTGGGGRSLPAILFDLTECSEERESAGHKLKRLTH